MTKLKVTNCLIIEDPSLMFSIVKVTLDQTKPGSLFACPGGSKMRDPGNEDGQQLQQKDKKRIKRKLWKQFERPKSLKTQVTVA